MKDSEQGINNWFAILIILVIILVGGGASYMVYRLQQNKVNDLSSQVSALQNQIKNKSCPTPTPQPSTTVTCPDYSYKSTKGVAATVYTPAKDGTVSSPVGIVGMIPGNWSFEAQFPVKLLDSTGHVVASAPAMVLGPWQTADPEPFSVQLTYTTHPTGTGALVLQKDNPSGLPANDDSLSIPVHL